MPTNVVAQRKQDDWLGEKGQGLYDLGAGIELRFRGEEPLYLLEELFDVARDGDFKRGCRFGPLSHNLRPLRRR